MIYSKFNLLVSPMASKDPADRGLNGVRFEPDGSTVAGNGSGLLAVAPVSYAEQLNWPGGGTSYDPPPGGLLLTIDLVGRVLRNMPKGKDVILQHALMCKDKLRRGGVGVAFETIDAKGDSDVAGGLPRQGTFPEWQGVVRSVASDDATKICVNRKELIRLLLAMEKTAPDGTISRGPGIGFKVSQSSYQAA
jgi:hypothetical protein